MLTLRPSLRRPVAASAALLAVMLGACSDSISPTVSVHQPATHLAAPALPSVVAAGAEVAERVDGPVSVDPRHATFASVIPSTAVTYKFTATPGSTKTWVLGQHMLKFPSWTICDPSQSTYGKGTWLQSCILLKSKISITATTWTDVHGRPRIDFGNALRFVPNAAGELPSLYLLDPSMALTSWGRIDYCSAPNNGACDDEAKTDAVLATKRDPLTGFLYRIIRHFSGYNVWA